MIADLFSKNDCFDSVLICYDFAVLAGSIRHRMVWLFMLPHKNSRIKMIYMQWHDALSCVVP
jgi:hypothetical protein